jgi:hypothetical protein
MNQLAKRIVDEATGEEPITPPPKEKNKAAQELGRLGGLKGGKARAEKLSSQQRSNIAKIAASARWGKVLHIGRRMGIKWRKTLSKSDAQQETHGAKMPFLRFTKGSITGNHTTWFRDEFFADAIWATVTKHGHQVEETKIKIHVNLDGDDLGDRTMRIDHDPSRTGNHNAPTTHLHYDSKTRLALESVDLSGHTVVVERDDDGKYHLTVL